MQSIYATNKCCKKYIGKNVKDIFYTHINSMPKSNSITPNTERWMNHNKNFASNYNQHYETNRKFYFAIVENDIIVDCGFYS